MAAFHSPAVGSDSESLSFPACCHGGTGLDSDARPGLSLIRLMMIGPLTGRLRLPLRVGQCSVRSLLAGPQDPRGSFASLGGAALVDNLKPAQATVTQLTFPS